MNLINFYRGIILTYPYGTYIRNRSKTLIIKSKNISSITLKPLLLIENKIGLGIIELGIPKEINLKQFAHLNTYHLISELDRIKWWDGYDTLYAYVITKAIFFKIPLLLGYVTGPQITIQPKNIWLRKIFIGTSGLTGLTFKSYAQYLKSIEINYTFYRQPTISFITNLQKYNLAYTIKVHQLITHYKQLKNIRTEWKNFSTPFAILKNKVICFLFQFSPKFIFNEKNFSKLAKLEPYLTGNYIFAFEFRDKLWFNNLVQELFKKNNWTVCISHVANNWAGNLSVGFNPKLSSYVSTSDTIYFRLHGTQGQYLGEYSNRIFTEIINFIKNKSTVKNVLIYFNNTDSGDALIDAKKLQSKFNNLNIH